MRSSSRLDAPWPPTPSIGGLVGGLIGVSAVVCLLVAASVAVTTDAQATRALAAALSILAAAILAVAVAGTWSLVTLAYVLDAGGMEIRYGPTRSRLRYEEVEAVRRARPGDATPPALWPGALVGILTSVGEGPSVWRATTPNPASVVTVAARGVAHVVTPAEVGAFQAELIERAQGVPFARVEGPKVRASWLDRISGWDAWVRVCLLAAMLGGTLGLARDVTHSGAAQPDALVAAVITGCNCAVALALSSRALYVGRVLAATGVAAQILAVF